MSESEPQKPRILVAEDHPVNRNLVERMLAKLGYSCQLAVDGEEVVKAVEAASFDIVLMDIDMPRMNGIEAARRIRALPGHEKEPRIIAVTANHFDKMRVLCLANGMDEFLSKPLLMQDLQIAIEGRRTATAERRDAALRRRLEELQGIGDVSFVEELIGLFRGESLRRLGEIAASLQADDLPGAARFFHQLQGSSANMGASELHRICTIGEEACQEGDKALAIGCHRLGLAELPSIEATFGDWTAQQEKAP
jgi:CheY-like chemotaxis protein